MRKAIRDDHHVAALEELEAVRLIRSAVQTCGLLLPEMGERTILVDGDHCRKTCSFLMIGNEKVGPDPVGRPAEPGICGLDEVLDRVPPALLEPDRLEGLELQGRWVGKTPENALQAVAKRLLRISSGPPSLEPDTEEDEDDDCSCEHA
jgi:hypothetical protein